MTTTTPDHNTGICHAASENRRMILEQLQTLAYQLENCENEMLALHTQGQNSYPAAQHHNQRQSGHLNQSPQGGHHDDNSCHTMCSTNPPCTGGATKRASKGLLDGGGHAYENRFVAHDPTKSPLSVNPEYPPTPKPPRTPPPQRMQLDLQRSKSRTIIGGVLITGCDCVRRNGLQDRCRRVECLGRPECMIKPEPTCVPGLNAQMMEAHQATEAKEKPYVREAMKAQKALEKHSCKYPNDWPETKNENRQKQHHNIEQEQQPTKTKLCCFGCPSDEPPFNPNKEHYLPGQFHRRLQCMEVDLVRGPLMNR